MSAKRKPTNFIRYACILQRIYFILSESPRKKFIIMKIHTGTTTHPINKKYKSYLSLKTLAFCKYCVTIKCGRGKQNFLSAADLTIAIKNMRGYGSVGRAMRSQCIGQGFESPYLHQMDITRTPTFSKAVSPYWCGCNVNNRKQGSRFVP